MKFAAIIDYGMDEEQAKALHPAHREYLRRFLDNEQLRAAGPFAKNAGALWILEAETAEAAEAIVWADPYAAAGGIVGCNIRPLAYWSAQAAKGER